jgi:ABC-type antimicrobial peptide transport system permease subunit
VEEQLVVRHQHCGPKASERSRFHIVESRQRCYSRPWVRVVRGRAIDERDTPAGKRVAVVSEVFARRFFGARIPSDALSVLVMPAARATTRSSGSSKTSNTGAALQQIRPMMFLASFQTVDADATARNVQARSTLPRAIVVRTSPGALNVEAGIRHAIANVDPNVTVIRVLPMALQVSGNFRLQRLMARLTSAYGVLALLLASLGLYGVTAYGVSQRTREIGVRMALGADRGRILRTCIAGPLLQTCLGIAIGLTAAFWAGRALSTQLYGVEGLDVRVFGGAVVALAVAAVGAAALPARRAASVNPATALRGE